MSRSNEPVFNEAFFRQLGRNPTLMGICAAKAGPIASLARTTAHKDSGDYARSIHVEAGTRAGRGAYLVVADDSKAMLMEARYGTLARATIQVAHGG